MDNVTLGGVATYLERAEDANVNLFILTLRLFPKDIYPIKKAYMFCV